MKIVTYQPRDLLLIPISRYASRRNAARPNYASLLINRVIDNRIKISRRRLRVNCIRTSRRRRRG